MPHRYHCPICHTTSPPLPSRRAALADRDRHRADFHGGHIPDGERITRRRDRFDWWGFWKAIAILLALPIADFLWRHL